MTTKRFSDFATGETPLDGAKIKIADVLNKEVEILAVRVRPSKFTGNGKVGDSCLTLQIVMSGERYVVFTGSGVLADQATQYREELPYLTVIKKVDKYYTFT